MNLYKCAFLCLFTLIGLISGKNDTALIPTSANKTNPETHQIADNLNQKINEPSSSNKENGKGEIKQVEVTEKSVEPQEETESLRKVSAEEEEQSEEGLSFMFFLTPISLVVIGLIVWRTMR
jgi:cobalamin biosynthesis Mg chelatase CobN